MIKIKPSPPLTLLGLSFAFLTFAQGMMAQTPINSLSADEKSAGWRLLWDGKSTEGWRGFPDQPFPEKGWKIRDGELIVTGGGGDLVTQEMYSDFELVLEFKITPGANSGIKYLVDPALSGKLNKSTGLEFQILDDAVHHDAKLGKHGNRTNGGLYDLIAPDPKKIENPVGEWNLVRILSTGPHVEHWLNGQKTVDYNRFTESFRAMVAGSKYKKFPDFGEAKQGFIVIQDHGNTVHFRNVKILTPTK